MSSFHSTIVIGAGPAGLTAAYELAKKGISLITFEHSSKVGGIARTETYKGYRFDIGGHRFFTKVKEVENLWHEVLGVDFIKVPRLSRIYYDGKFFNYPLEPYDALSNLGVLNSTFILYSYLKAKLRPYPTEDNLEQWVINRFGERLYRTFFKTYTEKVWGIPCDQIHAEWAAQRIKGLSLRKAAVNAVFGTNNTKTLIKEFDYPMFGPGMMWERFQELLEFRGCPVQLSSTVTKIYRKESRIHSVDVQQNGEICSVSGSHFISSMPLTALVRQLDPPAPADVLAAANQLKYRDFLIVSLIIDEDHLFPDNWIYIHSPDFKVGRIQNFKNWSPAMVPDPKKTCLGMEYFCNQDDGLWSMPDCELISLASSEVFNLGLIKDRHWIQDGVVIRQPKAYPVYDEDYRRHVQVIRRYLSTFENLQTIGRNGMHRYNNQDHSMLTGILAAQNVLGASHDLWDVNTERSYYEEFSKAASKVSKEPELIVR
ncbi:MAG: NAD(P)/FAD-dependent oxidoreductase [Cyanobacteria bacterium P01_C01_bin.70]